MLTMSISPAPQLPPHSHSPHYATGVACGIGAGALWGLVFLAPQLAGQFSPLELTVGRYVAYGLIAAVLIAPRWARLRARLTRRDWGTLAWLALAGNTVYYLLVSNAVQQGGIAMTSLVVGFLPVAVTIIGSRERDAVPLSRLAPSLLFCAAGAACIGWQSLASPAAGASLGRQVTGFLCAVGALVSWTSYAVGNRTALTRLHHISAHDWNLLIGVVTGLQALVLVPVAILGQQQHQHLLQTRSSGDWLLFAGVSLGVALLASILGNALWNRVSRLLPLTLVGQMILFETLFALVYGFLWERRLPTALEIAAFILVVMSVVSCMRAHQRPRRPRPHVRPSPSQRPRPTKTPALIPEAPGLQS